MLFSCFQEGRFCQVIAGPAWPSVGVASTLQSQRTMGQQLRDMCVGTSASSSAAGGRVVAGAPGPAVLCGPAPGHHAEGHVMSQVESQELLALQLAGGEKHALRHLDDKSYHKSFMITFIRLFFISLGVFTHYHHKP